MDDWQNFLNSLNNNDWPKRFDSIFECGFSAGYLTRWFSNRYFMDTNKGDFLKDRVMTFGASLTPDVVVKNGIKMFQEYAKRLSMKISFKSKEEFIGSFLAEYYRLGGQIKKNKDDFMIGFWSGFNLYPTGKGRKNNDQNIINQEDDTDE